MIPARRGSKGLALKNLRLLGGLPDGQRAVFSALTIEVSSAGTALYAADTDGQVFESLNEGETWTVIADVPPVSKGEFYRALVRESGFE